MTEKWLSCAYISKNFYKMKMPCNHHPDQAMKHQQYPGFISGTNPTLFPKGECYPGF